MSSKKTISINPELFSMTSSGKKKKDNKSKTQKRKDKKFNFVNPNQLRKNLLNKIKEHRENNNNTNDDNRDTDKNNKLSESKENNKDNIEKFTSNFKESMNYLSNLVEKDKNKETKSKRKRKQKTLKSKTPNEIDPNDIEVSLKLPDDFSEKINFSSEDHNRFNYYDKGTTAPPYGCLKGGDKPTFRQWKSSTQKNLSAIADDDDDDDDIDDDDKEFQEDLKEISKKSINDEPIKKSVIDISKSLPSERENKLNNLKKKNNYSIVKTVKRKYKLGKNKKNNSVSVLIKSTQTKKKIMDEKKKIENEDLNNIKKYLREHNLLRIGSTTPNDVLKTMYENAILSGYLENKSDDVMLHNYLNN